MNTTPTNSTAINQTAKTEIGTYNLSDERITKLAEKSQIPGEYMAALTAAVRQAALAYAHWHDIREAHRQGRHLTHRLRRLERLLTDAQEVFQKSYEHPGGRLLGHWLEAYGWLSWESDHMKSLTQEVKSLRIHIRNLTGRPGRRSKSGVDLEDFEECVDILAEFWAERFPEKFRISMSSPALRLIHAILKTLDGRVTTANTARLMTRARGPAWPTTKRPPKQVLYSAG